jgi:hypothetical protein
MQPYKLKLHEKKINHVDLVKQNGYEPKFLHNLLKLIKGTTNLNTYQKIV